MCAEKKRSQTKAIERNPTLTARNTMNNNALATNLATNSFFVGGFCLSKTDQIKAMMNAVGIPIV